MSVAQEGVQADAAGMAQVVEAGAMVEKLATGFQFVEGPVWYRGELVFSDIPANRMHRLSKEGAVAVFREPSQNANGNTTDRQGRLITCEHGSRRVTQTEDDGTITVLAERFEDKRLNSPNDVVVKSDGTIWFTDPPYGLPWPDHKGKELDGNYVFRLEPETRKLTLIARGFDMPNGLCFSPDEKRLYVADSGKPHHVRVFEVRPDNTLDEGRVFCTIDKGIPDGMRVDAEGRLYSTAGDGIHVFSPDGKLIGKIPVPETPANLCFGGEDGKRLYITAQKSLYAVKVKTGAAR